MANPDLQSMSRDIRELKKRLYRPTPERAGGFTSGSVLFASSGGIPNEDNANFFWNDTDNTLHIGGASAIAGTPRLVLKGTNADGQLGPHFQTHVANDAFPLLHFLSYSHDNMEISFDAYYDGATGLWKSSDSGSNFQLRKNSDNFGIWYESGVAQGGTVTWVEAIRVDTSGNMGFTGALQSRKNATAYTGYIFVPVTPLTSTAFDGDSFSTTAKTVIDLSASYGAPAGIKAVLMSVTIRDSGSQGTECILYLGPTNVSTAGMTTNCPPVNDRFRRTEMIVQCDANGDIYYQVVASGAATFDIFMYIHGYWI